MFQWSDNSEKNIGELNNRFTKSGTFNPLDGSDSYVIYCAASRVSLCCVLMQVGKVITYASR